MTKDIYNEVLNSITARVRDGTLAGTSICTSSTPAGTFSLDSLKAAVAVVNTIEEEHATNFNEKFVKPKGFDLERGDLMFVGREFDTKLIPSRWQAQVMRSSLIEPHDLYFVAGSPTLKEAARAATWSPFTCPTPDSF